MGQRGNVLLAVAAGGLIAFGFGTLTGAIHWPGQRGAGLVSATPIEFPGPCSSINAAANSSRSVSGRTTVTVSARATGCSDPLYQFWIQAPGAGYQMVQEYSPRSSFKWTPDQVQPGTYQFAVWARDAGGEGTVESALGRFDVSSVAIPFKVNACSTVALSLRRNPVARSGDVVDVTARATGCSDPLYRFWVLIPGASSYKMIQDYSSSSGFTWRTTGLASGTYRIAVWARDSASLGLDPSSLGRFDTSTTAPYRIG